MDQNGKKVLKMLVRTGAFMSTAIVVAMAIDKVLPSQELNKTGKFIVGVGGAALAYTLGYKSSMFIEDFMEGKVLSDVLFGQEAWEE